MEIDRNERRETARQIIENTGASLFLTGKAGTGKTTFLRELRTRSAKQMVVTAPTGIAAINAGGVTLHSFFQLPFGINVPETAAERSRRSAGHRFSREKINIIRAMDLLVIDEISMVRADLLDAVDAVLRRFRDRSKPFGGVQLLMIGDLQQLPPVVVESERELLARHYSSPYFFDSHALAELPYETVELEHVYRQESGEFLDMLNAIRDRRIDENLLGRLNSRFRPGFNPADSEGYIRLTTHNRLADIVNDKRLAELPGRAFTFRARVEGTFPESSFPAEQDLTLKLGAQVMFIKNDTGEDRRFFNGMIGRVTAIDDEGVTVTPSDGGEPVNVPAMEWENIRYESDEESGEIREVRDGAFRQLPLKRAWAITIHKSQGLTFDRTIIDASASFTHGQTYVALSRCRTLEGLVLERPLSAGSIICDPTVTQFIRNRTSRQTDAESLGRLRQTYFMQLVTELFDMRPLFAALEGLIRIEQENFSSIYPKLMATLPERRDEIRKSSVEVTDRFMPQLARLAAEGDYSENYAPLLKRIREGSEYYGKICGRILELARELPREHDNRKVQTKLLERLDLLLSFLEVKMRLFDRFISNDFNTADYIDIKSRVIISGDLRKEETAARTTRKTEFSADNHHPRLADKLTEWRLQKARELDIPAYTILTNKSLLGIANFLPHDDIELMMIPGIGRRKLADYGEEILRIVKDYMEREGVSEPEPVYATLKKKKKRHRH